MGKTWEEHSDAELLLNYTGIRWGMREKCHCYVRRFGKASYIIPKVCTLEYFQTQIEPGMKDALKTIKAIAKARKLRLVDVPFKIMTEEAMMIRELGWESYKAVTRIGLGFAKRGIT